MNNFLTESDLNAVKGLLHYLNENLNPANGAQLSPDVGLTDSNGEPCGNITFNTDVGSYVLEF